MLTREIAYNELAKISAYAGARMDFVQSGGGNASVKTTDRRMYIKASGFELRDIAGGKGIASVRYKSPVRRNSPGLDGTGKYPTSDELIQWNHQVINSANKLRPSIEVSMHALLGTVVLHTHPIVPIAFLCIKQSKDLITSLFQGLIDFLYIPYAKPGIEIGVRLLRSLESSERKSAAQPPVILLENHGIVVHGETADEVIEIHEAVLTAFEKYSNGKLKYQSLKYVDLETRVDEDIINRIKTSVPEFPGLVCFDTGTTDAIDQGIVPWPTGSNILFPDAAVFCGAYVIDLGAPGTADGSAIMHHVLEYREQWKQPPHVWKIGNLYVCAGTNISNARSIAEVCWAHETVFSLSNRLGEPRYLNPQMVDELLNWEAEVYRKTLSVRED